MTNEIDLDLINLSSQTNGLPNKLKKAVAIPSNEDALGLDVEHSTHEATALINQRIGRKSVIDAVTKLLTVSDLIDLINIKETKAYKGAQLIVDGKLLTVSSWSDFCQYCEGRSNKTIDLEILNLESLGQPTFDALRKIGIGPSTMRSIRQVSDTDRAMIEQVANSGNKDELIDLVDGIVSKHQKDKAELNEKVTNLEADLEASGRRTKNMDAEIERQEMLIERLSKQQRITQFDRFTEDCRQESMVLQAGVELNLKSLQQLFESSFVQATFLEVNLCIEQVYIATCVAVSKGLSIIEAMRNRAPELPERVQGQHVLTPAEAERWQLDFESLKNAHGAAEAARQIKRDADQPRGRGRPAKAKAE